MVKLYEAAQNPKAPGHKAAIALTKRKHYRCVYRQSEADKSHFEDSNALLPFYQALCEKFPKEKLKIDNGSKQPDRVDFPVLDKDETARAMLANQEMPTINKVPAVEAGYIFASPDIYEDVQKFLYRNRKDILGKKEE